MRKLEARNRMAFGAVTINSLLLMEYKSQGRGKYDMKQ